MNYFDMLVPFIIIVVAFFLLRELWTWYWKINKLVSNQETLQGLLMDILAELKKQSPKEKTRKTID